MQLATSQLNPFRDKGTKCVTFRTGNDYFMTIENILFRHQPSTIFNTVVRGTLRRHDDSSFRTTSYAF